MAFDQWEMVGSFDLRYWVEAKLRELTHVAGQLLEPYRLAERWRQASFSHVGLDEEELRAEVTSSEELGLDVLLAELCSLFPRPEVGLGLASKEAPWEALGASGAAQEQPPEVVLLSGMAGLAFYSAFLKRYWRLGPPDGQILQASALELVSGPLGGAYQAWLQECKEDGVLGVVLMIERRMERLLSEADALRSSGDEVGAERASGWALELELYAQRGLEKGLLFSEYTERIESDLGEKLDDVAKVSLKVRRQRRGELENHLTKLESARASTREAKEILRYTYLLASGRSPEEARRMATTGQGTLFAKAELLPDYGWWLRSRDRTRLDRLNRLVRLGRSRLSGPAWQRYMRRLEALYADERELENLGSAEAVRLFLKDYELKLEDMLEQDDGLSWSADQPSRFGGALAKPPRDEEYLRELCEAHVASLEGMAGPLGMTLRVSYLTRRCGSLETAVAAAPASRCVGSEEYLSWLQGLQSSGELSALKGLVQGVRERLGDVSLAAMEEPLRAALLGARRVNEPTCLKGLVSAFLGGLQQTSDVQDATWLFQLCDALATPPQPARSAQGQVQPEVQEEKQEGDGQDDSLKALSLSSLSLVGTQEKLNEVNARLSRLAKEYANIPQDPYWGAKDLLHNSFNPQLCTPDIMERVAFLEHERTPGDAERIKNLALNGSFDLPAFQRWKRAALENGSLAKAREYDPSGPNTPDGEKMRTLQNEMSELIALRHKLEARERLLSVQPQATSPEEHQRGGGPRLKARPYQFEGNARLSLRPLERELPIKKHGLRPDFLWSETSGPFEAITLPGSTGDLGACM